jgi:Mlc titration factor MtfA (ptsG expression regulator)/Zn-finger nucleic acid-binding protein
MIFSWLKKRRRRRLLAASFPTDWLAHLQGNVAHYGLLGETERAKLRDDLRVLIAEKTWEGCGGLAVTDEMKVTIAAQACLLLLGVEHDYFSRVQSILVYPAGYRSPEGNVGPGGVVHEGGGRLGEAWYRGPVVLGWEAVRVGGQDHRDGRNVVLHEFAHQLDFLDGWIDGTPPLKSRAQSQKWHEVMTAEYARLVEESERGKPKVLDAYGATDPAEFFAVATECFFEKPVQLLRRHPALYEVLRDYYGQDVAGRFTRAAQAPPSPAPGGAEQRPGRRERREGAVEKPTGMRCPRDGGTLASQNYEADVQADVCPSCRGMWLDRGELERIQETVEHDHSGELGDIAQIASAYEMARQKAGAGIPCPRCQRAMASKEYGYCSQILIDLCPHCEGVWLDRGEIQALERFFERERTRAKDLSKGFWASLTQLFPLYRIGTVTAQFVRKAGGEPLSGAGGRYSVKLFDKDVFVDDKLGEPRLDAEGRVRCTFDLYDVASADSPQEQKPDLYLVVYEGEKEIFRTPVFQNLDFRPKPGGGGATPVTHDLGTFKV